MRAIKIMKRFPGRTRSYNPGLYLVPEEITKLEARMSVADGYGRAAEEGEQAEVDRLVKDFRKRAGGGERKGPAPEDKQRGAAPENKLEVGDGSAGGDSGAGSEPNGARALTTETAVKRSAHRGK